MESSYGIGVKNRYELFYDDEEDPLDIIKQQEDEKKKKKETKQQQEKENKLKGPGPAPSKIKNIVQTKKGPKENPPAKAQEPPVPRKDGDNNRTRNQKVQGDKVVKFSSNIRDENKDIEERKNKRNREDNRPERSSSSSEFRERGGFDRSAQWDGERNERGVERERSDREPREARSGDAGESRRGRGGFGIRGGGGGGFRGRGGRPRGGGPGTGNFDNRGKREFERQSGSDKRYNGIKAVDKREGGGSHNWGTIRDDMDNMNNAAAHSSDEAAEWMEKPEETTEVQSEKEGEQPLVAATEGESDKPAVDDGPKIMTLDEWKKEQEKKRAVPQFNIRKAGEGEDSSQWKRTYVLKKKNEEEDAEEMEEEDDEDVARRGRAKHVVDIEINYSDSRRGRGRGRGGRGAGGPRGGGGGRGGFNRGGEGVAGPNVGPVDSNVGNVGGERGGRGGGGGGGSGGLGREGSRGGRGGGGRGGNKNQSAPKVDDENDFPSLVAA